MKRKEKKSMLLRLHKEVKLLPAFVERVKGYPLGFCSLIKSIGVNRDVLDILYKYTTHPPYRDSVYWFPARDWKIRLSFLEEVMRVELNPFYRLMYKLGLYKFKY